MENNTNSNDGTPQSDNDTSQTSARMLDADHNAGLALATPARFDAFPYDTPYGIQLDLMKHLYQAIESRSLAIIESPTGTGKTLSLLTAALTWLHDDRDRARNGQLADIRRGFHTGKNSSEPAWVIEQSIARKKRLLEQEDQDFADRLAEARKREEIIRRKEQGRVIKKARGEAASYGSKNKSGTNAANEEEDRFLPEDGENNNQDDDDDDILENMSTEVKAQIRQMKNKQLANRRNAFGEEELDDPVCTKIFFASRTHTQLTQATSELRRIKLPRTTTVPTPARPPHPVQSEDDTDTTRPQTRAIPLGSRKNLCINEELLDSLRAGASGTGKGKGKGKATLGMKLENEGKAKEDGEKERIVGDLDEACRELNNRPKDSRCSYFPSQDEQSRLLDFRDHALSSPRDIEDLVTLGKRLHVCPYYGSRRATARAEVVTLPYNLLLHKTAREALGISLEGSVVVVDEAHNLIDTVLSIHSCSVTSSTLQLSLAQLKAYYERFRTRLSPKHALHLKRLVLFVSALSDFCRSVVGASGSSPSPATSSTSTRGGTSSSTIKGSGGSQNSSTPAIQPNQKPGATMMTVGELVSKLGAKVDGFNLLEVVQYLRESKLARKITGYCDYVLLQSLTGGNTPVTPQTAKERRTTSPPLHAVEAFLLILVDPSTHGRIFVELSHGSKSSASSSSAPGGAGQVVMPVVTLKYQLLNPEDAFREVVHDARAVILAGGTMTPMSDFTTQLFSYLPPKRIKTFSCGHVIPAKNLQTLVLTQGPRKVDLVWKFDQRGNREMMEELGQMILNIASIVPHGLVVFVPSYAFLEQAKLAWESNDLLEKRLTTRKKVFFEPRESTSGDVEALLRAYAEAARAAVGPPTDGVGATASAATTGSTPVPKGAILFAVVGAKVSEGLNFADELARAVVVVGLPFANLGSKELQERMRFVRERSTPSSSMLASGGLGARDAGMELYENMCMKAVNQSIGRAIRHQNDWASLILIDQRYSTPRIRCKLPKWISGDITVARSWGDGLKELGTFYRERKTAAVVPKS